MKRLFAGLGLLVVVLCGRAGAAPLQFQPVTTFSTGQVTPLHIAAADFNGDGKPDLAVSDSTGGTVSVFLNQGAGGFAAPVVTNVVMADSLGYLIAGDFNEDGIADLVVSIVSGTQNVSATAIPLLGKGDGSFTMQAPIAGSFSFLSGRVADFNGDGHQDLLLGGNGANYLFLGQGNGSFTQGAVPTDQGGAHSGTAVADFNLDGHPDGVFGAPGNYSVGSGFLGVFLGDGTGVLGNGIPIQSQYAPNPISVDTADFNGDGKPDLLVGGNGIAVVYLGNGDATFQTGVDQPLPLYAEPDPGLSNNVQVTAYVADLNQDGIPDAVALDSTAGLLSLAVNDATGRFVDAYNTPYTFPVAPGSYYAAVADFNGDGLPDIVTASSTSKVISLLLSKKVLSQAAVSLTSSGAALLVGTPLKFQATISGGAGTPTGTVSLLDAGTQVAQQSLDSTGAASFSTASLGAGTHTLTAAYSGDPNYSTATSGSLVQVVTDFQVAVTPASQSVSPGGSATYSVTLTPSSGFNASVAVACSGLPAYATCQPPASASITGGAPVTTTLSVTTKAPGVAALAIGNTVVYGAVLFGSLCLWMPVGSRRRLLVGLAGLSVVALSLALSGCSGGSKGSSGGSSQTTPGTPEGTSSVTLTATATQNGITSVHTMVVSLVVQ